MGAAVGMMLGLGCAATATSSVATADAATSDAAADAATTGDVTVRVGLGPLVPPRYRAGVRVRVTDGARRFDALTDASGYARFTLGAASRWDLTAAEPGYSAVSLLGVTAGFSSEVLLRSISAPPPPEVSDVTVRGVIRGRSTPRSAVVLDGARGTTVARDDAFTLTVPTWAGAPPLRVTALELNDASAFLNGWISPPIDLTRGSPTVTVDLPAVRAQATLMELRVEYPVLGRLTPERFDRVLSESVARVKYTEAGVGLVPVGRSQLQRPGATAFSRWGVEAFEGELAPELIFAAFRFDGPSPLSAAVTTRPSFRGVVPAFAPVTTLAATARASGEVVFDASTTGWSRAAFTVTARDTVAWEGYAVDVAPWEARALPPLPEGMTLRSLTPTPGPTVARACVLRDLPLSPLAWMSPAPAMVLRNLLTVCEEQGATLR